MADKRVNVLVYSGMSLPSAYVLSADVRMQAMAPRLSLSVTASGRYVASSVQTMLSFPFLASRFSKSHGLLLVLYLLCPVEQMLATVAL